MKQLIHRLTVIYRGGPWDGVVCDRNVPLNETARLIKPSKVKGYVHLWQSRGPVLDTEQVIEVHCVGVVEDMR